MDYQTFRHAILPKLKKLDQERIILRNRIKKLERTIVIIDLLLVIAIIFLGLTHNDSIVFFVIVFPVVNVVGLMKIGKIRKSSLASLIKRIKEEMFNTLNPTLTYHPHEHVFWKKFVDSKIFINRLDRYAGEDYVQGMQGKTAIEFSQVYAEEIDTTVAKNRYVTFFKGLFMVADFHKTFKGRTVILPDTAESMLGWVGKSLQKMNFNRDDLVYLENSEFEKHFVVYSTDQVEARYILSTAMIDRILVLKKRLNCSIYFSFIDSKVNIAIATDFDFFEPRLKESILDETTLVRFYNDLSFCLGLVEDLNLNTRIWGNL